MFTYSDDILLLKLIQEGDEKAFKYLFDAFFVPLCRYTNLLIQDTQESEELMMDLFLYVWEHKADIKIKISFKAYLFQSARNRSLNFIRDRKEKAPIDDFSEIFADDEGTSRQVEIEELNHLIEEVIFSLPDKCRCVFIKSRENNLTNQEIADEMSISVKTVETQITKAIKHIKSYLKNQYYYLF